MTTSQSAPRELPEPLDLQRVRSISIHERSHRVRYDRFAELVEPGASFADWLTSLPRFLAADDLRAAVRRTADALQRGSPLIVAMGGHVVKVGLAPIWIDLMQRGLVRALVLNGATAIHDVEIGLIGETSEDVATNIADGRFGMARETAEFFGTACRRAVERECGLGHSLGELLRERKTPHVAVSMIAQAARLGVPVTVHTAIGTDVVHMHPQVDGGQLGAASHYDFRLLAAIALELGGGVWLNVGSAVVLPEVFLKVVNLARNVGCPLAGMTAIDFDMLRHYRTSTNVLDRPVERGIRITGHHEINIPLFRLALLEELRARSSSDTPCEQEEELG